jgi:xanthine dehydrogenase/oxidase
MGSKAVGEPPLLLAQTVHGAVKQAIRASRVQRGKPASFNLDVPASPDRVQQACEISTSDMSL